MVADGRMTHAAACMFTNTPDRHFILDKHPGNPNVRPPDVMLQYTLVAQTSLAQYLHVQNLCQGHVKASRLRSAVQVVLCSACSGHGFKFCSVVGEILADLAIDGNTAQPIDLHRIKPEREGDAEILAAARPSSL